MSGVRLTLVLGMLLGDSAAWAATLTVNTSLDTVVGACGVAGTTSLRKAIGCAGPGDTITFATTSFPTGTVTAIAVTGTQLPNLSDNGLTLDGGGRVRLDGSALAGFRSGLHIIADAVQVTGLEIVSFPASGVVVNGAANVVVGGGIGNVIRDNAGPGVRILTTGAVPAVGTLVSDNLIGTDATGSSADGNCTGGGSGCAGVLVGADAADTVITGNVISGNTSGPGVLVRQSATVVSDNLIGTNAAGSAALPNQGDGILVTGGLGVLVTGVEITGNQVSGNAQSGVVLGSACAGAIVQDNRIGTDPAGDAALPNGQDGVRVSGSDGHIIGGLISGEGNVISGNLGSGIAIGGATGGDWASDVFVGDNRIGTNAAGAAALANGRYGIVTSGRGGAHQIGGTAWTAGGNLVSGNALGGVWIGDPHVTLTANRIGTDTTGLVALPNGLNPLGLLETVFGGILADARAANIGTSATSGNLVSGNAGDGIWLRGEGLVMAIGRGDHAIYGNTIGTDVLGAAVLPNQGDGVRVEVGDLVIGAPGLGNLIAGNEGVGVHLLSNDLTPVVGVVVEGNEIGRTPLLGSPMANLLGGIQIDQDELQMPVLENRFLDNVLSGNGEHGIHFSGPTSTNTASGNRIYDSDLCAIFHDDGAQGDLAAPTILSATSSLITVLVPAGLDTDVDRVEVYSDSDTEAETWLGDATLVADRTWTLSAGSGPAFPPHPRIRALMVMADGTSSALTDTCGDGCAVPSDLQCDDGNACTTEWCDERPNVLACVSGAPRPVGWRCEDGDRCTGVVTATTFLPDTCDGYGMCLPGEEIEVVDAAGGDFTATAQSECPWSTDCNVASCTPAAGCAYAPLCDSTPSLGLPESACTPDDLDWNPTNNDCEQCGECVGLDDDDGDGLKNDWELNGVDTDCDGTPDFVLDTPTDKKNVLLEIDYMSANCGDPLEPHTHKPSQAAIDAMVASFLDEAGITLTVDVNDCIPEVQLIAWSTADAFPGDPDCNSDDFVFFNDLKVEYFDAERRGIYHYAIFAHAFVREHFGNDFLQNDGLCLGTGRPSGEWLDDDVIVTLAKEEWVAGDDFETFPTDSVSALMHELGHNFGLNHGGEQSGDYNRKPNYQSEMNYRYSYGLDDGSGVLESNYSREVLDLQSSGVHPVGDEAHLNEAAGLQSPTPKYKVEWDCAALGTEESDDVGTAATPIPLDFDCDGDPYETDVEADINGQGGIQPDLEGWDDWDKMYFHFQCGSDSLDDGAPPDVDAGFPARQDAERMGLTFPLLQVGVDIAPSCAASPVLVGGGSSIVKVVVAGDAGWSVDDLVPWSVRLQGAPARRLERVDVDADTIPDAVLWFDSGEMFLSATASQGYLSGRLESGRRLSGYGMLTAVASLPDADGDGVTDVCDACAATSPGVPVDDAGCP